MGILPNVNDQENAEMTEEEAKTKWCPMARQGDMDGATYNRDNDGSAPKGCRCVGSGCALWAPIYSGFEKKIGGRCGLMMQTPR